MRTSSIVLRTLAAGVASVFVLSFLALSDGPATAGGEAEKRDGNEAQRVRVVLVAPVDAKHRPIYERLTQRGMPERLAQFLSPVRLPRELVVTVEGCKGDVNASLRRCRHHRLLRIAAVLPRRCAEGNFARGSCTGRTQFSPRQSPCPARGRARDIDLLDIPVLAARRTPPTCCRPICNCSSGRSPRVC